MVLKIIIFIIIFVIIYRKYNILMSRQAHAAQRMRGLRPSTKTPIDRSKGTCKGRLKVINIYGSLHKAIPRYLGSSLFGGFIHSYPQVWGGLRTCFIYIYIYVYTLTGCVIFSYYNLNNLIPNPLYYDIYYYQFYQKLYY